MARRCQSILDVRLDTSIPSNPYLAEVLEARNHIRVGRYGGATPYACHGSHEVNTWIIA